VPRPPEIDAEFIAGCDAEMRRAPAEKAVPDCPDFLFDEPSFKEIWYAGAWLGNRLDELGCPLKIRKSVCFRHGQLSFSGDPWKAADACLRAFRDSAPLPVPR
jgi:hypothetical protein